MKRAIVTLLLGGVVGYWMGYRDAQRGPGTVGARVAEWLNKADPSTVRVQHQQQADTMRERIRAQSGGAVEP